MQSYLTAIIRQSPGPTRQDLFTGMKSCGWKISDVVINGYDQELQAWLKSTDWHVLPVKTLSQMDFTLLKYARAFIFVWDEQSEDCRKLYNAAIRDKKLIYVYRWDLFQ